MLVKPERSHPENRSFIDLQDQTRELNGLRAVYSVAELDLISDLPAREVAVIHSLKALCGGEIHDSADPALGFDGAALSLHALETQKGPAPEPTRRRRKSEPLPGQTTIAA